MQLYLLTDPLRNLYGSLRPPYLLAKELKNRFNVCFVSPAVDHFHEELLRTEGFNILNLGKHFLLSHSLIMIESWLKRITRNFNRAECLILNFSQCFHVPSHVYYAQGLITRALRDVYQEMRITYKIAYWISKFLLSLYDKAHTSSLRAKSLFFVANSKFSAEMYREWGIKVDEIIYPPLDCREFRPSTSKPSEDYVISYAGKETKYSVLKSIADAGIIIKVFGSKNPFKPVFLRDHPNVSYLGRVSHQQLIDLYSNALFTLFPFTHEPFGYVPVESMACGTPVLTFGKQGPRETVLNGITGWLASDDKELVRLAVDIWKRGYPRTMRAEARRRALAFDTRLIAGMWSKLIDIILNPSKKARELLK